VEINKDQSEESKWWQTLALAVLVFQPLFFYRRHLFRLTSHIPFDIQTFHLPLSAFIERSVKEHVWPFWNPLMYSGGPIHADMQAQLFYPFTWLAILANQWTGGTRLFYWLEWLIPLHMIIGGVAAYFMLKQFRCSALVCLFGATVFQIGAFFVSQAEHLGSICSAAWFPFVLLCLLHLARGFHSRWFGGLALSAAMSLLGGFPATAIVIVALSGFFCIALACTGMAKTRLFLFCAAGWLLAGGIAAIQLIPTLQLSSLSVASLRYKWRGNGGGMPWESLASFIWPNYYHIFSVGDRSLYTLPYEFTFMFTFCGHVTLVLIAMAPLFLRKSKLLVISVALFVISALWMIGENTPVYPVIFRRLPHFLQSSIYAEIALLGFSMFAATTGALVLAHFERNISRALLVILVAINSWNLIRLGANKPFNSYDGGYEVATASWDDGGRSMPAALSTFTQASKPALRISFLSESRGFLWSAPGLFNFYSADGDNPFLLLSYFNLRHTFSDEYEWSRKQFLRDLNSPWIRALNIGYIIDDAKAPNRQTADGFIESLPFQSFRIYKVKDPLPRFYLQTKVVVVRDEEEGLKVAKDPAFDPTQKAIVEELKEDWQAADSAEGTTKVLTYENNRIELDVQTFVRSLLVTSEPFYPGWTATVDNRSADILRTNVAFRGIFLEPGRHHVVMRYFPSGLVLGLTISLLALAITLISLMRTANTEHCGRTQPSMK
jgi:Bacterial membrane protein YfhO